MNKREGSSQKQKPSILEDRQKSSKPDPSLKEKEGEEKEERKTEKEKRKSLGLERPQKHGSPS